MAYDQELAQRVREILAVEAGITERRMFGGLAFLVRGNMAVAASGQGGLMVRVDPGAGGAWLDPPAVQPMEMRGRQMLGWLRVTTEAMGAAGVLETWVARGVGYATSLPPKGGAAA